MMDEEECRNIYDLLKGSINRMFLTDDLKELENAYGFACSRLKKIYQFQRDRILGKENDWKGENLNG